MERKRQDVSAAGVGVPRIAGMAAAGFAVAMGLGRFSFTPILPLMIGQAGLSSDAGALLATANYLGYLVGPVLALIFPRLVSSWVLHRWSLVLVVVSLLGMSFTIDELIRLGLRFLAGAASALLFVVIASSAAMKTSPLPQTLSAMRVTHS
ncbi:YbfB/YjiJ family MFS transporter [Pseudarthrobacter sp. PS3-L1]|uniref:YbfB/YjiJ family MFS transporter n=1 Tax=Pseudarthrobacter sp. PS3-L1 TaxID=3046207 RepID=UPI0024B9F03B|nr:YbfB/YjiJ family MFS transporter [Pseudarthrobacter sp. PS3-L1]MDJ0319914.1 YbfB/YjiJ family MFS transporter [Pseudarthrobacter sp. PS3-L1]